MADQNFRVKRGLEVGVGGTVITTTASGSVGIGSTNPTSKLFVVGSGYFTGVVTASSFSGNASSATYSSTSGIATYATNAGISTYSSTSGIATYATSSGIATYASTAGIATYATNAGISTYSSTSGIATYATSAGIATYASTAGIATYATSAGIATYATSSGIATYATSAGIATYATTSGVATALQNARNFSITGNFVTATAISFDGTGNVALAATITPDSIGLGTYTTGDYVKNISGTSNQITVTGGTGEGSTPTLSIPSQFTAPQDVTVTRDLQVNRNLNVTGNITIGGTTAFINVQQLQVADPDLVLGFRTDAFGNDVSNDTTANHGGIAIASTEGNPLVSLYNPGIGESTVSTYKKIMWFKSGSFSGLGTDAWLINYAVGIGSTQFPAGTRLASGNVQFTQNDLSVVRNINASGVVTATSFSGNASSATYATSAGVSTSVIGGIGSITQIQVTGISTFSNGPVFIGSGTSTGTAAQPLQVTGGAYVSGNLGIGTTNPTSKLSVGGDVNVSGVTTSTEFIGGGADLRNLSGTHLVSYASASSISNSALSISGISTYNQVGILTGSYSIDAGDNFGNSLATSADGKTIVVGATSDEIGATTSTGIVYVFDRVGNSFNQVGILTGFYATDASDRFGNPVATSADGKTIVVGARFDEIGETLSTGIVYVFDRVGNSFNQVGILTGSYANLFNDQFGNSIATSADGKTIVVGAQRDAIGSTGGTGIVYVFDRVGNSFNQVGILTGSYAVDSSDNFGYSVATSADGKTIFVGTPNDEIGATTSTGIVYVFDRVGNSFNQVGILTGSLAVDTGDSFGQSVATSADGKTIVVGAYSDEIGATSDTGIVYVFDRVGNSFNQVGILTGFYATDANDGFGWSVSISADGKTIVVGDPQDETGAIQSTGVVYVFNRVGDSFNQVGILTGIYSTGVSNQFGLNVTTSADGKSILVGTPNSGIGTVSSTGIVYVFDEVRSTYLYSSSTGNIGIGSATPQVPLDVIGNARFTGIVTASSFSGNASSATYATTAGVSTSVIGGIGSVSQLQVTGISTFSNGPVFIGSGTSTGTAAQPLQVTGGAYVSGNLGIGTTNPTQPLDVNGNVTARGTVLVNTSTGSGSSPLQVNGNIGLAPNSQIRQWTGSDGGTLQVFATQVVSGSNNSDSYGYSGGGLLAAVTNGDGILLLDVGRGGGSPLGRFKITNTSGGNISLSLANGSSTTLYTDTGSGNLGIGTASPAFKADIAGDARVTSTNKMRFGGTAGTTNFYIQYNSTANSLDFVAG